MFIQASLHKFHPWWRPACWRFCLAPEPPDESVVEAIPGQPSSRSFVFTVSQCVEHLYCGPALKRWGHGLFNGFLICPSVLGRDSHFVEKVGPLFSETPDIFLPGHIWPLPASRLPVGEAWSEKQCHRVATRHSLQACSHFIRACVEWVGLVGSETKRVSLLFFLPLSHPQPPQGLQAPPGWGQRTCQAFRSSSRPCSEKRLMT